MRFLHDNIRGMIIRLASRFSSPFATLTLLALALSGCVAPRPDTAPGVHILDLPVVVDARAHAATRAPAVPAGVGAGHADANLKLWLYDPRDANGVALATGIFLRSMTAHDDWRFTPANPDGSLYLALPPGDYEFDVVEPDGTAAELQRHRYLVTVAPRGTASVLGLAPNDRDVYAVTLDLDMRSVDAKAQAQGRLTRLVALANEPASTFHAASSCQLMDQVTAVRNLGTDVAAGFPKVRVRLASSGRIRALIVPVDFADLKGRAEPATLFAPLARDMHDFYLNQSYGQVNFEFDILSHWVRLPFGPERFGIGAANGVGDFYGYRSAIIGMTDGQIDYAGYDAVYFLVPKEMPMARMGSGPAITVPTVTGTGYVINGATGGGDMYYNEARGIRGAQWKWMAHETGHAFGLVGEDWHHASQTLGWWSIMAYNWSNGAIEHNGWDRYLQGWLPESQVACLGKPDLADAGARVKLSPIERRDGAVKAAMVPLGESKILVLESRRNEGYDHIAAGHEGVLAYTVDTALGPLGGGYRTQRRPGSTAPNFEDAALHPGDAIAVDGVRVTVGAADADGDTVMLQAASR